MKTISKRFLKASVALLLVVIMLFGSTISGFAAVVDNADTKANVDIAETGATITSDGTTRLYFNIGAIDWWTSNNGNGNFAYFFNGSNNKWSAHSVQYSGSTYYFVIPEGSWTTVILTRNNTSTSPSWDNKWNQTGDITLSSTSNYISKFSEGSTSATWGTAVKPASTAKVTASSTTVAPNTEVNLTSSLSTNADINTISDTTYSVSSSGASVIDGKFSATTPGTYTVTATVTYYPNGYSGLTSTAIATTTITVTEPKYTVTTDAGVGGTAQVTGSPATTTAGVTLTATPASGYAFEYWEITNGTGTFEGNDNTKSTVNFYPTSNATVKAHFKVSTYKATFEDWDGTKLGEDDVVPGGHPTPPENPSREGYTFTGWAPSVDSPMNADTTFVATYTPIQYTATWKPQYSVDGDAYVDGATGGTVEAFSDANCTQPITGDRTTLEVPNTTFYLKVTPADGYRYAGVTTSYNPTSTAMSGTLQTDGSYVIYCGVDTAREETQKDYFLKFLKTYDVNIDLTDGVESITYSYGDVTGTIDANTPEEERIITVDVNTEITFTANYVDTYIKGTWSAGSETSTDDEFKITVTDDVTVSHTPIKTWDVTVNEVSNHGTVLLGDEEKTSITVNDGDEITLKVTPIENYVATVTINNVVVGTNVSSYEETITVTSDTIIKVEYTDISCKLNFTTASEELEIGQTFEQKATKNTYCEQYGCDIKYSSSTPTIASVDETTGVVTALKPGTVTITATCDEGATATYTVTVNDPVAKANKDSIKLYPGHTFKAELELDDVYNPETCTIDWAVGDTGATAITVNADTDGLSADIIAGASILTGGTVTATITYVTGYTKTVTINVDVIEPTITTSKSSLSLEYGEGSSNDTGSFTISTNLGDVEGSCDLDDTITVTTEDSSVATATLSGTTVTVNAKGLGSTNVVISYHGVTKNVSVSVKKYDAAINVYLYVNKSTWDKWTEPSIYVFNTADGSNVELTKMAHIGTSVYNSVTSQVYAVKVPRSKFKTDGSTTIIFNSKTSWSEQTVNQTATVTASTTKLAYYLDSWNDSAGGKVNLGTSEFHITLPSTPSIDVSDVTVKVGETKTVNATHSGSNGLSWNIPDSYATVTANNTVADVKGVTKGRTTLTVCSFASLTNCSLNTLDKTNPEAWPFIGATATANVRVLRADSDDNLTIYLSSGKKDMGAVSSMTSSLADADGKTISGTTTSHTYESYNKYSTKFQAVEITTTVDSDYMVDSFVVYKIESRSYEIYPADMRNSTTYAATTDVLIEDCYIYPVFFHTDDYMEENGLEAMEFYFEFENHNFDVWGPFVACYAYGTGNDYFGDWPGQLMIPTEDGSSFYTRIEIKKEDTSALTGVLFNNFVFASDGSTAVYNLYEELGLKSNRNIQTYDYREPISLFSKGYDTITYVLKDNKDGYHGNHPDGTNNKTYNVSSSTKDVLTRGYNFDYLYRSNGSTLMDLNGNAIENVSAASAPAADYYIVSKGDVTWGYNGTSKHPAGFNGYWATTWHVFDKTGKFITEANSDYFYYSDGTSTNSMLVDAIIDGDDTVDSADDLTGKVVKISYEAGNQCPQSQKIGTDGNEKSTQYKYDGQWYGRSLDETMHANVIVGLENEDGSWTLENDETPNDANYGTGYLITEAGEYAAEEDITIRDGIVALTASSKEHYKFVGWYTSKALRLTENFDYTGYINNDTTYYAIFKRLGEKEVIISHSKYNNTYPGLSNDAIRPHNGTAIMKVEVYDKDGDLVKAGYDSTSRSYVSFDAEEHGEYTVKIYTTPQNKDTFFAWYTDSLDADGNPTYEEMLTRGEDVGNTREDGTIETSFKYYTDSGDKEVNIYSDLIKVSVYATLEYNYYNRYNQLRVISKTVKLTDQEVEGFEGNDGNKYCPAYLDYYYFGDKESATIYYDREEALKNIPAGYDKSDLETGNNITDLAPNFEVTEAVNQEIRWTVDETRLTHSGSYIKLLAEQSDIKYTVNYTIDNVTTPVEDYYNELLDIEAPLKNAAGDTFSYWKDRDTNEIISYSRFYSYRIVENRDIEAVYGATDYAPWSPVIENVTQTREYQNYAQASTDVVYIDYLLAFHNVDKKELRTLTDVQYGVVTIYEKAYEVTEENVKNDAVQYPVDTASDALLKSKVEVIAKNKYSTVSFYDDNNAKNHKYTANHYELTGSQNVTNLNRLNFVLSFDNKGTDYYKYAFSTYAYIIAKDANNNDVVYISKVENANIFETATAAVE